MLILCVQLKRSERHASESEKKADQGKPRGAGNCATCASTTVQKQDKTETATTSVPGTLLRSRRGTTEGRIVRSGWVMSQKRSSSRLEVGKCGRRTARDYRKEATTKTNREREKKRRKRRQRGLRRRRGLSTTGSLDVWTLFGPISLSEGFAPGEVQQRVWAEKPSQAVQRGSSSDKEMKTIRGTVSPGGGEKEKDEDKGRGDGMGSKGWDEMEGRESEREREREEEEEEARGS